MRAHELARHICLAAQPVSVHGSPDTLVQRGVEDTLAVTEQLADAIVRAVSGKSSAKAIAAAATGAAKRFGTGKIAKPIERELLHGALLGALDAGYEAETGHPVKIETFAELHGSRLLAFDTGFAARPIKDAIAKFLSKKAVTRDVYDAMEAEAKRRAFTVAGMANAEMVNTVKRELVRQVAVGADLREFGKHAAKRFEAAGWVPANPSHVQTVFRTNVMGAYSGGRIRQMSQPDVLAVRPYWESLAVGDGPPRQRKFHVSFVLLASDAFWQTASPPYGYNCFLPGTLVQGPIIGASRARYSGKAVQLTTAKGRRLTVTANHPVLTAQGFAPADALRVGRQLICYASEPGVGDLRAAAQADHHDEPTPCEKVFGALAQSGGAHSTRAAGIDFHGEAARFDGEIEIVGSYRQLMLAGQTAQLEQALQTLLEGADLSLSQVAGLGARRSALWRIDRSAAGDPSFAQLPLDSGVSAAALEPCPLDSLSIGAPAQQHAFELQGAPESAAGDAAFIRELFQRGAGSIELDQIIEVRELDWSGHVYDFEARGGWLVADGVVTSNCRCRLRSLSVRQGAPRVQAGSSIRGLPDPGFTSGIGALFEGPPPPSVPKQAPANDPPPEQQPANDPPATTTPANDATLPQDEPDRAPPPVAPPAEPAPSAPAKRKPKAAPRQKPPPDPAAIEREIAAIRKRVANLERRKKPAPQSEFDALRKRIDDLLGALVKR